MFASGYALGPMLERPRPWPCRWSSSRSSPPCWSWARRSPPIACYLKGNDRAGGPPMPLAARGQVGRLGAGFLRDLQGPRRAQVVVVHVAVAGVLDRADLDVREPRGGDVAERGGASTPSSRCNRDGSSAVTVISTGPPSELDRSRPASTAPRRAGRGSRPRSRPASRSLVARRATSSGTTSAGVLEGEVPRARRQRDRLGRRLARGDLGRGALLSRRARRPAARPRPPS